MAARILRLSDVVNVTGLSRSAIYQSMKTGDFPHSISLGLRSIGWIESEVQAWIDSKIAVTRNQAGVDL